jgi:hypothetical protein
MVKGYNSSVVTRADGNPAMLFVDEAKVNKIMTYSSLTENFFLTILYINGPDKG